MILLLKRHHCSGAGRLRSGCTGTTQVYACSLCWALRLCIGRSAEGWSCTVSASIFWLAAEPHGIGLSALPLLTCRPYSRNHTLMAAPLLTGRVATQCSGRQGLCAPYLRGIK